MLNGHGSSDMLGISRPDDAEDDEQLDWCTGTADFHGQGVYDGILGRSDHQAPRVCLAASQARPPPGRFPSGTRARFKSKQQTANSKQQTARGQQDETDSR
jgi:hypothetical protein